jgi:hypothetical protein
MNVFRGSPERQLLVSLQHETRKSAAEAVFRFPGLLLQSSIGLQLMSAFRRWIRYR